jgi:divinyl chlorophyllide a 8-vinyl-reductase
VADVTDAQRHGGGVDPGRFDAVVSCLASRSGAPKDAWAIDHDAQVVRWRRRRPQASRSSCCSRRSACRSRFWSSSVRNWPSRRGCSASGLTWSIVRPTAFFKSLSGQIARVRAGKPFLLFGDGTLTACKPISDDDLGRFIAACLIDPDKANRVLPIGGPALR